MIPAAFSPDEKPSRVVKTLAGMSVHGAIADGEREKINQRFFKHIAKSLATSD